MYIHTVYLELKTPLRASEELLVDGPGVLSLNEGDRAMKPALRDLGSRIIS